MKIDDQAVYTNRNPSDRSLSIEEFKLKRGQVVGQSDWFLIDQAMVDKFAEITLDRQFIHVDPERARDTNFGGTVAHGFLVLSLLSALHADAVPPLKDAKVGINYGFNRVRFVSPVNTGCRIRAIFMLAELEEQKPNHWRTLLDVKVQIDGISKPAMVAEWLNLWVF
jgi:acyl dehydratase